MQLAQHNSMYILECALHQWEKKHQTVAGVYHQKAGKKLSSLQTLLLYPPLNKPCRIEALNKLDNHYLESQALENCKESKNL
jgi:hypothetical protein